MPWREDTFATSAACPSTREARPRGTTATKAKGADAGATRTRTRTELRYDPRMTTLVIRHATVIDGTRAPRYQADIAISGGRITAIGPDLPRGDEEIDASGRIAAPGFIDAHTHDDRLLLSGDMAAK